MNHYNGATVWGQLDKYSWKKTETGKPYLEMFVNCIHAQWGNVRLLGRIWKKDIGEILTARYKHGDEMRLEGNIQQYQGRNEITRTTFNFWDVKPGPLKEQKAAFRLVGEVQEFHTITNDGTPLLKILVVQDQKDDFERKEEEFEVYVPNEVLLEANGNPVEGQIVRVKGYLVAEEDEFGGGKGPQRPVVRCLEVIADVPQ